MTTRHGYHPTPERRTYDWLDALYSLITFGGLVGLLWLLLSLPGRGL